MRSFEDICREYGKKPEEVERDLLSILHICTKYEHVHIESPEYHYTLVGFLHSEGFISRGNPGNKLTPKGQRAIKNRIIYYNIKESKKLKRTQLWKWLIPIIISAVGILITIVSIFIK